MLSEWHSFLSQSGALIEAGRVTDFGDSLAEQQAAVAGDVLVDLSHLALLRATGPDGLNFLQGQLTCDVRRVTDDASQLGGHCSPKGRILCAFRLFKRQDSYYLAMPAELLAATLKRLRMYVLMSKVTLDDASDELARIGVSGPHVVARLAQIIGALPQGTDSVSHTDTLTVVRVAGPHPRVEVFGPIEAIQSLWQDLAKVAKPAGAAAWALLDIRAGIPSIHTDTVEAFVPQMVNLQLLDGVSFRKGCYTGQEVVARMQYLGKLKRRMYLAHVAAGDPKAGDELYCADSESGQGAGKVVDAQAAPGGGFDLLAVVQTSLIDDKAQVHLRDAAGAMLEFRPLPYPFPVEEAADAAH